MNRLCIWAPRRADVLIELNIFIFICVYYMVRNIVFKANWSSFVEIISLFREKYDSGGM